MRPFSLEVEHHTCNVKVASSILAGGSFENRTLLCFQKLFLSFEEMV